MMLKIEFILLLGFISEVSQDVLADSRSCSVPVIENGVMGKFETRYTRWSSYEFKTVSTGEQVNSNKTLFLRCNRGFFPVNDSKFLDSNLLEVTCNDGEWSKVLPCKKAYCTGEPPAIKNGNAGERSKKHGIVIWYVCNDYKFVKVQGNVTCHFGEWIGNPPKCLNNPCYTRYLHEKNQRRYPGLIIPPQEYFESMEGFEIDCEYGFRKATPVRKINCVRGRWDISQNPCIDDSESCSRFPDSPGLKVTYARNMSGGSFAAFSCLAPNKILIGSFVSVCGENRSWSNPLPSCEDREEHTTISTILPGMTSAEECFCTYDYENPFVKAQVGQRKLKPGDKIMRGETVSFECKFVSRVLSWQNGFRFFGKANMTCNACEKWQSNHLPTCDYTVSVDAVIGYEDDLKILPGGIVDIRKGERRQFFCSSSWIQPQWDYGEKKDVSVNLTQVSGRGNIIFVSLLNIMRTEEEHSGKYECYMRGDHTQRIGSSFFHLQVDDFMTCSRFPDTPGLKVTYSKNVSIGSVATFSCSTQSKSLIGSPSSVCLENASWSNPLPSCGELKCSVHNLSMSVPEDVVPDMTGVNGEFLPSGSLVELKCSDNSVMNGNSKALCGEHGKWVFGVFQCVPGCILNLDRSPYLLVHPVKDRYRLGESISLSCPPGKKLSDDVELLMCLNNKWTHSMPDCEELEDSGQR